MNIHLQKIIITAIAAAASTVSARTTIADSVDTRVGTAASETRTAGLFGKKTEEFGQTLPAVLVPNGMNFWTPQTRATEHKCVAPYYYDDSGLQGFRNSHWIVGGCTQDYGSMTIMPLSGTLRTTPEARASRFSHADELATPYYYKVTLTDEGITAEMTATSRAAIFRFTYNKGGKAYIVVNPNSDEGQGFISVDPVTGTIQGYNPVHRIYQGKGQPAGFSGHFVVETAKKPVATGTYQGCEVDSARRSIGYSPQIGAYVELDVNAGETIVVKAASSFVSADGARANLQAEIPGWDFNAVSGDLKKKWEKQLGSIDIDATNDEAMRKFYTAMYHASFLPHEINDVDGRYPAFAGGTPIMTLPAGESAYYDGFSMWDTYRALHPLINLLHPQMGGEMMQSLVHKYEQGGWMPIFPCWNSYTAAMIGDHCAAAIADAYCKGIRNFDVAKAYEGLRHNAFDSPSQTQYIDGKGRRALKSYLRYGYIPVEDTVPHAYHKREQTSRTLEYAFDDYALSTLARDFGSEADYKALNERARNYRNVINPVTGYADARHADGEFAGVPPTQFSKHITEGAPCHYTWYAPHDPYGLIDCMGGQSRFTARLDSMFSAGRYWHGNEPCHQVAYMYAFVGQPWKTAAAVRHVMDTEYLDSPGGLSGNDDAGQMSAWYVFSALGFYPVCPASPYYIMGSPSMRRATLNLENGKKFTVSAPAASDKNIYIASASLNGEPLTRSYLTHDEIMAGGELVLEMTDRPGVSAWGTSPSDRPPMVAYAPMLPEQTAGIYMAYPRPSGVSSPAPDGYEPFYVSHYGRHGSRWVTEDARYLAVVNPIDSLYKIGRLTPLGENLRGRLHIIWADAKGRSGCLTPLGERQHRDIARRMYDAYTQIFADSARVNAISSTSPRCAMSMSYFTEALKERNPQLRVHRSAYDRDMAFIAHTSPEGKVFSASDAPWRKRHAEFARASVDPSRLVASLVTDTTGLSEGWQRSLMDGLYWIASDLQNTELTDITLYDIFTIDELTALWRTINARMYICNGDAPVAEGVMVQCAAPLLSDIIERADSAVAEKGASADLRFGHDTHLLRLLALMGIPAASGRETDMANFDTAWRDYTLSPMAANVQLVFYRNGDGPILTKVLLNEEEVILPIDSDVAPYYRWNQLRDFFMSRIR